LLAELLVRLNRTIVVATHDVEFARRVVSRILIIREGGLLASGTGGLLQDTDLLERAHLL
jgi:ABC-type proline/glycine betaine transport system ATPase subunit